ncbi:MAG: acetyl/propionyl/methylcrotonyl-CoA carboxylase subunit alpha [Burkholderiales bacterium]|jgi:propionyl-CoA carboxylase alpha chain
MFTKILIANRGEIACRVIKTARRMGIATVAVYSEADRDARHVALADEAVFIGPAPARESYLVMDKIIAACRQTGAQAVHPGYGFLSENAEFSKRVEEEGIVFIGPKHGSIAAMGDKIASKKLAKAAQVSTIPGWNEPIETAEHAVEIAKDIGYPVMIKASAGGGGKGLRVAFNDKEAFEGFTSCRNEARNSFGDDRVFIEKFIEEPRHIEIQVLGDGHGNVVYLWERECSIQRRHQKLIEEAPSAFLDRETAKRMGEQAVALAKAVDYQSAGTVEFVVGKDKGFYFLEMNTRLQVEHPVTECITGLDLVEQMIRVAAGEKLAFTQKDVKLDGWALECRINAEDPSRGFLPSTGRLIAFQPPATSMEASLPVPAEGGVRVDTGVYEGGEIPMQYDSMIAKLIVKGRDRTEAIARMRDALDGFVIRGISNNVGFQSALIGHPRFATVAFNTGFVAENYPNGYQAAGARHDDPALLLALAGAAHRRLRERAAGIEGQLHGRSVQVPTEFVAVVKDADSHRHDTPVTVTPDGATLNVSVGEGKRYAVHFDGPIREIGVTGTVNGRRFAAQIERKGLDYHVTQGGAQVIARMLSKRAAELYRLMPEKQPPDLSRFLLSPMPGLLVDVAVAVGQQVRAGERLAVIEAMKMENVLVAQRDAVVKKVSAGKGESLSVDQVILEFE